MRSGLLMFLVIPAVLGFAAHDREPDRPRSRLRVQEYVSDTMAFNVVSTLIIGPTEVMLVDAQMAQSDGRRVAELIAATGRRLTSIVITHPDEDHTFGLPAILARFPGTPVYMTAAGAADFARNAERFLKGVREYLKDDAPDSVVTPQVLPSNRLTVDGETIEIVPDLQGDVLARTNSFVHIPSLRTVIAGDIVFSGVHPFLAHSTVETRRAWLAALDSIAVRQPRVVIPGHKPTARYSNSPKALAFMAAYLRDFDASRQEAPNAGALESALRSKYPTLQMPLLLRMSAHSAFASRSDRP